jgi:hypothetical protein
MLRDAKTWNAIVFNLEPEVPDFRSEEHCLRIQSHYPEGLNFVPTGRLDRVRGKVFASDSGEAISNSYILLKSEKSILIREPMRNPKAEATLQRQ